MFIAGPAVSHPWLTHLDMTNGGLNRTLGQMPVADDLAMPPLVGEVGVTWIQSVTSASIAAVSRR